MSDKTEIQKYRTMLENLSQQPENLTKLEQLAEHGNVEVMYVLGWCYFKGGYLSKDLAKSQYWLEQAILLNYQPAQKLKIFVDFFMTFSQ